MTEKEQRKAAKEFAERWKNKGYEKGQSQPFWLDLLVSVFGVSSPSEYILFEDKVNIDHTSFIDGRIPATNVLIEQKSIDKSLTSKIRQSDGSYKSPFQQAKAYSIELPYSERPRWIIICNFKEFHIYDMENPKGEPESILLEKLDTQYERLSILINKDDTRIQEILEISIKAGELVGELYDSLLSQYNNPEDEEAHRDLNILCVRLVFCFYAEDSGLFEKPRMFYNYLFNNKHNFRNALKRLFQVLNQDYDDRDPYLESDLSEFPYVNGGLFKDVNIIPTINEHIIDIILDQASAGFDWSNISPTIFGAVFESTLNPETRRSGGMHYTSIENIHKIIDPLFMNDLNEEFEQISELKNKSTRKNRLIEFQNKLANIKIFDPAAGSGNFLTESYIALRKLENKVVKLLVGKQVGMGLIINPIKVKISQFYGIEINDFAVTVAKTALWIAESQMINYTEDIILATIDFLPLRTSAHIIEGNSLKTDWDSIVQKNQLNYIIGNPPFIGARLMKSMQTKEIKDIFNNATGSGNLDYVAGWFKKAQHFIQGTSIEVAFVATNSISQGEQVALLWKDMLSNNISINFAYTTFKWKSEASDVAAVHCVIIGFSCFERRKKYIFEPDRAGKLAKNINPYLVDAPNAIIERRNEPISDVIKMRFGSMPNDGENLTLSADEKNELINKYPQSMKVIRKYVGAYEYINGINRFCLWIEPDNLKLVSSIPPIMRRIEKVKEHRLNSTRSATNKLAATPYAFAEIRQPSTSYLLVPSSSTENRRYIPIGYEDSETIASNATLIIPNAPLYVFAILTSNVHMAWMRAVGGRLKSDYRYSAQIVYNNFPWVELKDQDKEMLNRTAQEILDARSSHKDMTLAQLYNELIPQPDLRTAHQNNDRAVMKLYGFNSKMTESECVAELMKMYQKLVKE